MRALNRYNPDRIQVVSCNANEPLAKETAKELNIPLSKTTVSRFADGEIKISIDESVRGSEVFVMQPTSSSLSKSIGKQSSVNDNLMELLIMGDGLRRAGAEKIHAVMPYFGYGRQDRKAGARDPISAKVVSGLISKYYNSVTTIDLHADQIQGFFDDHVDVNALLGSALFGPYYKEKFSERDNVVVVAADYGDVTRARKFAEQLGTKLVIIGKNRPEANKSEVVSIDGHPEGKIAILIDDMVDTAGTLCNAAKEVINLGATEVYACASHGVLSGPAIERIENSPIKELALLNTIDIPPEKKLDKINILTTAEILALTIKQLYTRDKDLQIMLPDGSFNREASRRITPMKAVPIPIGRLSGGKSTFKSNYQPQNKNPFNR